MIIPVGHEADSKEHDMSFAFPVFVINACLDKMICSRTEQRDKEVFAMDIGRGVYARSKLSLSWVNLLYTIKFI